jgi:type VI secretion system secreted protein Hcp
MRTEVFLKLDGVRGGSQNTRHLGSIEVAAFTWGDGRSGSGGGPGKAHISDLIVTKAVDAATPVLRVASNSGQYFRNAELTVEEFAYSGHRVKTVVWKMADILIDSITSSGHSRAGESVMEAVKLNFANYRIERR